METFSKVCLRVKTRLEQVLFKISLKLGVVMVRKVPIML